MLAQRLSKLRSQLASNAVEQFYENLSSWSRKHPKARPHKHGVEILDNIPYANSGREQHLMDIYRPVGKRDKLPVIFYVHGGGFRILSKDTHWVFGLGFARKGYLVVNINYHLAPDHPFPEGMKDVCAAYQWVCENIHRYGGDPDHIVLAGESAGANLVTSLAIAACSNRDEEWAKPIASECHRPVAVMPSCGLLQVSDSERFERRKPLPRIVSAQIKKIQQDYLKAHGGTAPPSSLADPLLIIEEGFERSRPLPPFFLTVGTRDPILDDTRRLDAALQDLGVSSQVRYYKGELHAFHALVWRPKAKEWWRDSYAFLDELR